MKTSPEADLKWMCQALALARRGAGLTRPNPPVGAVVVKHGRKIGQGWHKQAGGPHAEIFALRQAGRGRRLGKSALAGAVGPGAKCLSQTPTPELTVGVLTL